MATSYFSDRERGPQPRIWEEVSPRVFEALRSVVQIHFENDKFAMNFPEKCDDWGYICGTDGEMFVSILEGNIPGIEWASGKPNFVEVDKAMIDSPAVFDLLEFCHKNIAEPTRGAYHPFFRHYRLSFDESATEVGQESFREDVNTILARNRIVFDLKPNGRVERILPPALDKLLTMPTFDTGDNKLNSMLEDARSKFVSRDPKVHMESLKDLWDAWERLKTLEIPVRNKKKQSFDALLDSSAIGELREPIEKESVELTRIGNDFGIRHSETYQNSLDESYQADYLFYRMFALINMLLIATQRVR